MKAKTIPAFLLMLCMIVFALFLGANKGWQGQAEQVASYETELRAMLQTRVEGAYNLAAVAGRHVAADDANLAALIAARTALEAGGDLAALAAANRELTAAAHALCDALAALPGVQASARDSNYVVSLRYELDMSDDTALQSAYNAAAADFNARLSRSLSGALARLTGVRAAQAFE